MENNLQEIKLIDVNEGFRTILLMYLEGDENFLNQFNKYKTVHTVRYNTKNINSSKEKKYINWLNCEFYKLEDMAIEILKEFNSENLAGYIVDDFLKKYYPQKDQIKQGYHQVKTMRRV